MPRRPSSSGFSLSIDDDFDESQNYRVKLFEIEERESQFADSKGAMAIVWKMSIYREDGTAFENPRTGELFDLWAWTSDSTFRTSKGRGYIEAFMGREMQDDEVDKLIDNGFADGLVGKTALGSFEIKVTTDGNERLQLILLRPDRPARGRGVAAVPAASAPPPPPSPPPPPDPQEPEPEADEMPEPVAPVAAARPRRRIDD